MIDDLVPAGLRKRLLESRLAPGVLSFAQGAQEHFRLSGIPFFKEYTDHSFQHSVEVFKSACDMISEQAFEILSADDINLLLLASIAHDAGLHITDDMFLTLTDSANTAISLPFFDKKSWPELWASFLSEAQRFHERKLIALFGDNTRVRVPPRSSLEMTQRDRLLIGEFIRRHHARYAHEFMLGGALDAQSKPIVYGDIEQPMRDIAGLVARSHGVALRDTFGYIEANYDLRDFNRIHIIYLMVLLRVSDFLQIQPGRAPVQFGKLHKVRSPFSLTEWKLHQCIDNITTSAMDPEAIFISARPKDVHDYLKFDRWKIGLQEELDKSWAVLGEVYGRFTREALNKLQITIRRVRSNCDDKETFQENLKFVAEQIKFTVAEPELLRLLMGPLYGQDPAYGLRELTQNSCDSVIELHHLVSKAGVAEKGHLDLDSHIKISVRGAPDWTFTIEDKGTGMTLETIQNYFLRAGASFRNSEIWKDHFTSIEGQSQIARTGRFGVGALSAFLIGDRIRVFTRHYTEKSGYGYGFECGIDDEEIQITRQLGEIGTSITVLSSESNICSLQKYLANRDSTPFFFISEFPRLEISILGEYPKIPELEGYKRTEKIALAKALSLKPTWISAECAKYERVIWDRTYRPAAHEGIEFQSPRGYLYCNGIVIGDLRDPSENLIINDDYSLFSLQPHPTVSVTDNDAQLPVDLARKGLATPDADLSNSVRVSVYSRFLAEMLLSRAQNPSGLIEWWASSHLPIATEGWFPFLFGPDGFSLIERGLINLISPKILVGTRSRDLDIDAAISDKLARKGWWFILEPRNRHISRSGMLDYIKDSYYTTGLPGLKRHEVQYYSGRYLVVRRETFRDLSQLAKAPGYLADMEAAGHAFSVKKNEFIIINRYSDVGVDLGKAISGFCTRVLKHADEADLPLIVWTGHQSREDNVSVLGETWMRAFGVPNIAYEREKRLSQLRADSTVGAAVKAIQARNSE